MDEDSYDGNLPTRPACYPDRVTGAIIADTNGERSALSF